MHVLLFIGNKNYQSVRQCKKHYSLYVIGTNSISCKGFAFHIYTWKIIKRSVSTANYDFQFDYLQPWFVCFFLCTGFRQIQTSVPVSPVKDTGWKG